MGLAIPDFRFEIRRGRRARFHRKKVNADAKVLSCRYARRQIGIARNQQRVGNGAILREGNHVGDDETVNGLLVSKAVSRPKTQFEIIDLLDRCVVGRLAVLPGTVVPIDP